MTIEYADEEPQSVKIILNAKNGRFKTRDPKIKKRDRLYIRIIEHNGVTTDDVFHVRRIKKKKVPGMGSALELTCPHQSENAWNKTISMKKRGKRISGHKALELIVADINANLGSSEPLIEIPSPFNIIRKTGNRFDTGTSNNYFFEAVKVKTAIDQIKDIENQPTEGGGSFERMNVRFKSKYDHATGNDLDKVELQAFEQGYQENGKTARAIAKLTTGIITSIQIINQGADYVSAPTVTITGRGTGATATAVLTGGKVTSITIDNPGSGYTSGANISIEASPTSAFTNIPNVTLVKPTLASGNRPNILSMDSNEDPEEATNILVIADKNSGSYPTDLMKYQGAKEVFLSAREHNIGINYLKGQLVTKGGVTYECILENIGNSPPNATFWIVRTFVKPPIWGASTPYNPNDLVRRNDIAYKNIVAVSAFPAQPPALDPTRWVRVFFPPTTDYSKLTKDKVQYWVNALSGAKYAATNNGQTQIKDPNCVIDDPFHPRTIVDYVDVDPANIPAELLVDGNIPDAFRMLAVFPTGHASVGQAGGTGNFAGNDPAGLPYAGNIVEFFDDDNDGVGTWKVFKSKVAGDDQEVIDDYEGIPWVRNPCTGIGSYVDNVGVCHVGTRETKWLIGSYALSEIPLVGKAGIWVDNKQFECMHSVKWDPTNLRVDMGNEKILNELMGSDTSAVFIKSIGATAGISNQQNPLFIGFNFHSRWPKTSNAIPFGAVSAGEAIKNPTTDLNNMDLTHLLKSEWFGPGVEDYFPFQAFAGWLKLLITDGALQIFEDLDGDFTIGIFVVDRRDKVMVLEFTQGKNVKTLPMEGPLSKLKAYKGVPGVSIFFSAEEPDGTVAFDPTEYLFGGIYTRDSFDKQGRYKGILNSRFRLKTEMKMSLDMFRLTKPVVATNIDDPDNKPNVNIETLKIQKKSITGYSQAKNLALGLDKLLNFDRREINIVMTNGRELFFGDSVYINDSKAIDDSDDSLPNTFKGVVESVIISISKTKNGPAGIKKEGRIVRRFWPT